MHPAQLIDDSVRKSHIIGAQLARCLRQVLAGVIEVVFNAAGISHNRVAAG